jgi:hypothetical protein
MRKVLFLSVCLVALLAISSVSKADPYLYRMDADTAATMRYIDMSDAGTLWFVGYNPGLVDLITPPSEVYNAFPNMTYQVGFTGNVLNYQIQTKTSMVSRV